MPKIPCFQVDAFTNQPFRGNPAAVVLLEEEAPADWMQKVAAEMNLSETSFVWPKSNGFGLRWFTPTIEVDLCGHATLAAAHILWETGRLEKSETIPFHTKSGLLPIVQRENRIVLDFPVSLIEPTAPPPGLLAALSLEPRYVGKTRFDLLIEVDAEETVRTLRPDFAKLVQVNTRGIMVTCRANDPDYDFISRFFAPAAGINEDPVTGSAHCALGPYWQQRLGKEHLRAFQTSSRGGEVSVHCLGDRVHLSGQAVTTWQGEWLIYPR
ncbi:Phenazine biosynthesis protein PhzF like [Planctomycetales bacterium 10988]|nr:Phenazine biosynthesis protein PhzF like [Planctomycetales bacterium 10988]